MATRAHLVLRRRRSRAGPRKCSGIALKTTKTRREAKYKTCKVCEGSKYSQYNYCKKFLSTQK